MMLYEIDDLSFSYDSKFTLYIEKFEIENGIVGITGPSGSGKTTFLLNLAFLYTGRWKIFRFMGEDVSNEGLQRLRKIVTYVPQHPVLFRKSVFDNIAYPLKIRQLSDEQIKKKVCKIAEQLFIQDILEKKAWQISGGQAKRVCIARGFVFEPKVVLLDEPTSDLDDTNKQMVENFVLKTSEKTNIIVVSHDKEQLSRLCERVFFLENGRLYF
jgi:tungstate transport system ATP-binding protein